MRRNLLFVFALLLVALPGVVVGQGGGQLTGTVTGEGGKPIGGVTVVVNEASMAEITDSRGSYRLTGVPAGTYTVTYTLSGNSYTATDVEVTAGQTTEVDQQLDWDVSFAETITVFSASRRRERIVEAPAAITVVGEEEIERQSSHGQLPKLLEFTPGAEITQSGLYDFNLNTRGFNSSLNRRVPTLLDGRDPSTPFLMSQDWPSLAALEDLASAELIRGPSSALYGTNAYNGVLNLTTKQPKYSQGGTFRLTGGELSTIKGDLRVAADLGGDTYIKAMVGYTQSDDFYQSRCTAGVGACPANSPPPEYPGLPAEAVPLATEEDEVGVGTLRFDKYLLDSRHVLTFEGGYSTVEGPAITTGIGRVQILEADRPWGRLNYNTERFNLLGYYNKRDAPNQLSLASGLNLQLDSTVWAVEAQGNLPFAGGKGQIVGGASYRDEDIETNGTLTRMPVGGDRTGVFGQVDYAFNDKLKMVVAGRWDDSSLHDDQISPKAALVFSPTPNQTIRATYNEAFQSPNYSEFFLDVSVAAPVDLSGIEAALCTPFGVSCGFDGLTFIKAHGNQALTVEEVETWEIGYSGIFGGKVYMTLDYYNSELTNFVTDLIPNPQGSTNPSFGPYQAPANHPAPELLIGTLQGALGPAFFILSNYPDGDPVFSAVSYTNAGEADVQGIDFGLNYYVTPSFTLDASYSWFDFELKAAALADIVEANAPENKFSLGVSYVSDAFDVSLSYRWVEEFRWAAGVFVGVVPEYETVDLTANYRISESWSLGLNVANALDNEHYESFGGDILERRALGYVAFSW